LQKYIEVAKRHSGDAVSNSTMILTAFTMVCSIDKAVANQYPMLRRHKCGIKASVLPALLLPCRQDMQLLHETESYVTQRDTQGSKGCVMMMHHLLLHMLNKSSLVFTHKHDLYLLTCRAMYARWIDMFALVSYCVLLRSHLRTLNVRHCICLRS
jgi:hypothetical protein